MREQFLVEMSVADPAPGDLVELNRLFTAWVECVYHPRVHGSTGAPPLARWNAGIPSPLPTPTPAQLREAFLWSATRTVTKTATVSLHGNVYTVDAALVGCKVELVFDPFDLSDIDVRHQQHSYGSAIAFHIGRHAHPKARPETPDAPPAPTGIDYLHLLATRRERADAQRINFDALTTPTEPATGDDGQVA